MINIEQEFDYKSFLQTLTNNPGVYRMLNAEERLLYVGKAKNLRKRVATYFTKNQKNLRIAKIVSQTANVEITITNTEAEALLLENNLIINVHTKGSLKLKNFKTLIK